MKKLALFLMAFLIPVLSYAVYFDNLNPAQPLGWGTTNWNYNSTTGTVTQKFADVVKVTTLANGNTTFVGTVTAASFSGAITGNATSATALAANPTDCSSSQYATAIAANGNLTCAAIPNSDITGLLEAYVASNQTNATATPASTTMSLTVSAAGHYRGKMVLFLADSQAAEGVLADFDGGAATMTDFRAHCSILDTALIKSVQTSAIATDVAIATATGDSRIECDLGFTVDAGGTFIPRFAQNSHTSGTVTLYKNSYLTLVKNG